VTTPRGTYEAARLVVCPGAWAPQVLADLGVPLVVERQVMYWFQPSGSTGAFERHPIWIHQADDGLQLYGFPAIDGPDGGAKTAFFRHGVATTPETIDREVHDDEVAFIAGRLGSLVPALPGRFLRAAACMDTTTPDEHFVVAVHPQHGNVTVACGFSGHGFKFVPVVGEVLADLALEGTTKHPIALFDPRRPGLARAT
jgi:sarcosine oxidase